MLKTLKLKGADKDFFFAGCLHHNHNPTNWPVPLWKQRGFNSVQEHDDFQIKKWNETCDENSVVFLLGDTIFHDSTGENFIKLFKKLRFRACYVQPGNHFSGWLQNYKKTLTEKFLYSGAISEGEIVFEVYPLELTLNEKAIRFIPNYVELDINGQQIIISHYPIRSWNKMARNSWMVHSHIHGIGDESDWLSTSYGKVIDVGYEHLLEYNGGAPISLDKLKKCMDKKPYKPEGHH